ncbi:hypothetical protein HJC23_012772 [Cyclotella cryptica]|uniref:Hcy-binding domain-containing protein n=1 Tax=Cyclotella cryptica TaxID=29204 RepID=A0ABD3Q3Y6_9STRA|eukprot:CCRYP_008985-RA/>CCRYP_008985-RA protein AED:0.02 eAED:0.02 QI:0/-1/0/1/-1/1/1/0/369
MESNRNNDTKYPPRCRILLDGGMGHELKNRGVSDGSFLAGVLANADTNGDGARVVESVHCDFLSAGCDVITTNSFVAVPPRMIECGLATDEASASASCVKLITAAVDRARSAITKYNLMCDNGENKGRPKKIAGSVPPLTECYFAEKVPQSNTLIPGYFAILSTLLESGVDILLAETLSTIREATAILKALHCISETEKRSQNPSLWISFTIHDDKPLLLRSGEQLLDACRSVIKEARLLNISIDAIGVNCSTPAAISDALIILRTELESSNINLMCYGNCFRTTTSEWIRLLNNDNRISCEDNSSLEVIKAGCDEYDKDGYMLPETYARYATAWAEAGAIIIGGCCGCSPVHMKAVATAFEMNATERE